MKVNYGEEHVLKAGVPYTYGNSGNWYVLLPSSGAVLYLNYPSGFVTVSSDTSEWHRREVIKEAGFRYAESMEIL